VSISSRTVNGPADSTLGACRITNAGRVRRFDALTSRVGRILHQAIEADAAAATETLKDAARVDLEFGSYMRTVNSGWADHHVIGFLAH
jgi:hypothetical protein